MPKKSTPPSFPPEEKLNTTANRKSLVLILGMIGLIVFLVCLSVILMVTT